MTLVEAIKSGRPFRRKDREGVDYRWTLGKDVNCAQVKPDDYIFSVEDVLADDWEIQELKVEITRAQLFDAAMSLDIGKLQEFNPSSGSTTLAWKAVDLIARRLGLGDAP